MCARPGSEGFSNPSEPFFLIRVLSEDHNTPAIPRSCLPIFQGRSRGKLDMLMRRWLLLICSAAHYSEREQHGFHPPLSW